MYTGTNPAALRSRDEIVQAFLTLLENTSLENMAVKQLMEATDLSRQTFYQIFNSKEEILEYYFDTIFSHFIIDFKKHTIHNLCDAAKIFFAFFEKYKPTLKLIIQNGKSCVIQRKCREYLRNEEFIQYHLQGIRSDQDQDYSTTFVISGIVAMHEQWIREDFTTAPSANDLALLVCRITGMPTATQ